MNNRLTKKLLPLLALGALALGGLAPAHSAPTLKVSDGTITVIVVDNGPGDYNPVAGSVVFIDNVGSFAPTWNFTVTAGITKPLSGSASLPFMDIQPSVSSRGPGTLTFEFSDDFFGPVNGDVDVLASANVASGGTLTYSTFVSGTNTQFAGSPLAPPHTFTQTGGFNGVGSLNLPAPFAFTQRVVINHTVAGSSTTDAALSFSGSSGVIGDFVWNDSNQNGIQEPGEPGIDGVTVTLKDGNNVLLDTTVTATNGFYQFAGLPGGTYIVTVDTASPPLSGMVTSPVAAAGSTLETDSNPNPATVVLATDSSSDQTTDFGFYTLVPPTGQIGDFVWKDLNQDGIQTAGEPGINGVTVSLKDGANNVLSTTITAGNGAYLFSGLAAGSYSVEVDASSPALAGLIPTLENAPGSATANDSNGSPAAVVLTTNNSQDSTIDFGYIPTPAGSIGDYVWRDLNGDGIQGSSADEPGIEGVTVELYGAGNVFLATTTTDIDGYYLFTGRSAGVYTVTVANSLVLDGFTYNLTASNAVGSTTANDSNPNPATVGLPLNTSSDTTVDFGYTPVPAGQIGDFVWNDVNGNGIQDFGEAGINGVTVTLVSQANVVLATTVTSGNGGYLFTGLSGGAYNVAVDTNSPALTGFIATGVNAVGSTAADDSNPNPSTVTLLSNTSSDLTQDFGFLRPSGQIGDFVWKDLNQNGLQDAGEPGINGVPVKLFGPGNILLATTVTSGNGAYLFTDLPAGNYSVAVVSASPALAGLISTDSNVSGSTAANDSNPNPATVTLPTHSSIDLTIDFGFVPVPAGSIGDFVWKDLNANGLQNPGEPGIAGVSVSLYRQGNPIALATAVTDANGVYLFTGLSAGTYIAVVDNASLSLAGYSPTTVNAAGSTTTNDSNPNPATIVLATNTSQDVTIDFGFVPPPTGTIGNLVWKDLNSNGIQEAGEPGINGVAVKLFGPGNVLLASVVTAGSGDYLFSDLNAGTYTVSVDSASPALASCVPTTINAPGSNMANDSNAIPATVTLATNSSSDLTIDFGYKTAAIGGPLTTYTMGGWGAKPSGNNPAAFLAKNFAAVYPVGLTVGGGFTLKFTSAKAIENFLPCGSTARALTKSYVNPTTVLGVLAGQVVALRLGVDFSNTGVTASGLASAQFKSGKFAGQTVGQVLARAEAVLGGAPLPPGVGYSDLSDACALVNENYDEGRNSGNLIP